MSELVLLLSSITEVVVGVGAGVAAGSGAAVGDGSVAGARVAVDAVSGAEPGDIAGVPGGAVDDRFSVGWNGRRRWIRRGSRIGRFASLLPSTGCQGHGEQAGCGNCQEWS